MLSYLIHPVFTLTTSTLLFLALSSAQGSTLVNSSALTHPHPPEGLPTKKTYTPGQPTEPAEKEVLSRYLGYWEEGKNLLNRCSSNLPWSEKLGTFEREKLLLTLMATYQLLGVDLTARAIVEYGRVLALSSGEKQTFWKNLVGQYCSPNMTVISHKKLIANFKNWDLHGSGVLLPNTEAYQSFPRPPMADNFHSAKKELEQTVALFRSFCSWGGDIKYPRLLGFIFQDPQFSAWVIRTLGGKDIHYEPLQEKSRLAETRYPFSMNCQNSLCRKTQKDISPHPIPLMEDLYCRYLWGAKAKTKPQHKILSQWIAQTSPEQIHLMHGQLTALITGIPEFMLKIKNPNHYLQFLKSSYRSSWNQQSLAHLNKLAKSLPYEESLSLTALDHQNYYNPKTLDFKVKFQVAVGEFDKMLLEKDKLKASYSIKIPQPVLEWVKAHQKSQAQKARDVLRRHISPEIANMKKTFILYPWEEDIAELIINSLLSQLKEYQGDFSQKITQEKEINIPIQLAYGPFALKYIHFRRKY